MTETTDQTLRVIVLGAAAGGGAPQWNCNCPVCRAAWDGNGQVRPQTQSSIAVSADGEHWVLFNCSPDLRQQVLQTKALHPREVERYGRRDSPIHSVLLTNADVDHIAGLLILREKQRFTLYGTAKVLNALADNPIFNVLDPQFVSREPLALDRPVEVAPGLEVELFAVPGKVALFLEDAARAADGSLAIGAETEDTVGVRARSLSTGSEFFYIPGCARVSDALADRLNGARLVFFDGTVWVDDEMVQHGVGAKTGQRMGHMSMNGQDGSMAAFEGLGVDRKIFIHINNTNPVLLDGSSERAEAQARGWEIAYDGMEVRL